MTVHNDTLSVRAKLESLQMLVEELRGEFVGGIQTPADYARATAMLDELTDGRELNKYSEMVLIELEDAILAYERDSEQFKEFNATFNVPATPIERIRNLMETLGLTGSDFPEIGDKTAVSKVLNGDRPISHRMAYALAERFHMKPNSFLQNAHVQPAPPAPPRPAAVVRADKKPRKQKVGRRGIGLIIDRPAKESDASRYPLVASGAGKVHKPNGHRPVKG